MSIILTGDGVSQGIRIGRAIVVNKDNIDFVIPSFITKTQVTSESKKFINALDKLKKNIRNPQIKLRIIKLF